MQNNMFIDSVIAYLKNELNNISRTPADSDEYKLRVLFQTANILLNTSHKKQAVQILDKLCFSPSSIPPDREPFYLAWSLLDFDDLEKQKLILDKLIDSDDPQYLSWRCNVEYFKDGDFTDINNELKKTIKKIPENKGLLWAGILKAIADGERKRAVELLKRICYFKSDEILKSSLLQSGLFFLDETCEIDVETVKRLTESPVPDFSILFSLLLITAKNKKWSAACDVLRTIAKAFEVENKDVNKNWNGFSQDLKVAASYNFLLSHVLEYHTDNPAEAIFALKAALKKDSGNLLLQDELVSLLWKNCEIDEAKNILSKNVNPNIYFALNVSSKGIFEPDTGDLDFLDENNPVMQKVLYGKDIFALSGREPDNYYSDISKLKNWFEMNTGHEKAGEAAKILFEDDGKNTLAKCVAFELAPMMGNWPPSPHDSSKSESSWFDALGIIKAQGNSSSQCWLAWAEHCEGTELKSALKIQAASLMEKDGVKADDVINLLESVLKEDPSNVTALVFVSRILQDTGREDELLDRLEAVSENIRNLYEEAVYLERKGTNTDRVLRTYSKIIENNPLDIIAVFSRVRILAKSGKWQNVMDSLDHLIELCPKDSAFLNLIAGETVLIRLGKKEKALKYFSLSLESDDEHVSKTARLYRILLLYGQNNFEDLNMDLQTEMLGSFEDARNMWLAEMFMTGRAAFGDEYVFENISLETLLTPTNYIWSMLSGGAEKSSSCFDFLNNFPDAENIQSELKTASCLINTQSPNEDELKNIIAMGNNLPDDVVWYLVSLADDDCGDARLREKIYESALSKFINADLNLRFDWMLLYSEALIENGEEKKAFMVLNDAKNKGSMHPGILMAHAKLAYGLGKFIEAADTHGRLANFYVTKEFRIEHLLRAAKILFENIKDAKGAENILKEALNIDPDNKDANYLLDNVMERKGDLKGAFERVLKRTLDGQTDKDTEKKIAQLARSLHEYETLAESLSRRAEIIKNTDTPKWCDLKVEEARIRIEKLFDEESASSIILKVLNITPANVSALSLAAQFLEPLKLEKYTKKAVKILLSFLKSNPVSKETIMDLHVVYSLSRDSLMEMLTRQALFIVDFDWLAEEIPTVLPGNNDQVKDVITMTVHPDESLDASQVMEITAGYAKKYFEKDMVIPEIEKFTGIKKGRDDPVINFANSWKDILGGVSVHFYRIDNVPNGSFSINSNPPQIVLDTRLSMPLTPTQAFFLGRNIWATFKGQEYMMNESHAFIAVRWIMAVANCVLGDSVYLPVSTDRKMIKTAKRGISRSEKKLLLEPCRKIVAMPASELRSWSQSTNYSADRFGMLVSGQLPDVVNSIILETAGPSGMKRLKKDPKKTLSKIPRVNELYKFIFGGEYAALRKLIRKSTKKDN